MVATLEALKASEATVLKAFFCNYNDVESVELARRCTDILLNDLVPRKAPASGDDVEHKLSQVEFIGCECLKPREKTALKLAFTDVNV